MPERISLPSVMSFSTNMAFLLVPKLQLGNEGTGAWERGDVLRFDILRFDILRFNILLYSPSTSLPGFIRLSGSMWTKSCFKISIPTAPFSASR